MRKLMCLTLVLSGFAFGCSSDSGSSDKSTSMNPATGADASMGGNGGNNSNGISIPSSGGSDAGAVKKYPECPREMIPPTLDGYMGEKPFSRAEFMACQKKCGQDQMCFSEQNCPGFDAWNECANTEIIGCSGAQGGKCRVQYEDFLCCANESGCDPEDSACIQGKCAADIMAFSACLQKDNTCSAKLNTCFGPDDADAGTKPPVNTGDAGTNKSAAFATTPISGAAMMQLMQSAGGLY